MVNIARGSIDRPIYTWMIILIFLIGGAVSFLNLGRLEDPAFTIKQAVVVTQYPGATSEQVAIEVSEPLESAIQKMEEVDYITSINQPGVSQIDVHIKSTYDGNELPEVWTRLRAKVADAGRHLPTGVSTPLVNDSFGDVFGIFLGVTAEGFSDAEKHELATFLRRELLTVDGVADVDIQGLPEEAIFVEPDLALSVNQNISLNAIAGAIANADAVNAAGTVTIDGARTRIMRPDGSDTVSEIAGLSLGQDGKVVNLVDTSRVFRDRVDNPRQIIRFNGEEAFTLGVAGIATENIVEVGKRVDAKLARVGRRHSCGCGAASHL